MSKVGKYVRGLETELKILKQFTLNKEVYQYGLEKKIGVSYRTILRTLHELRELRLLRIVRKERSEKRGKERNVWGITRRGLLQLLLLDEETWKQIALMAEVHPEKLLTFKKWKFFEKENLKETITTTLRITLMSIATLQLSLETFYFSKIELTEEELQKLVDSMTLGCYALRDLKGVKDKKLLDGYLKILKACKKDKELRSFVESELNFFKKIAEERLARIKEAERL